MNCPARRESDEVVCAVPGCGLRWSLSEDRPECPRDAKYRELRPQGHYPDEKPPAFEGPTLAEAAAQGLVGRYRKAFPTIADQWPKLGPEDFEPIVWGVRACPDCLAGVTVGPRPNCEAGPA